MRARREWVVLVRLRVAGDRPHRASVRRGRAGKSEALTRQTLTLLASKGRTAIMTVTLSIVRTVQSRSVRGCSVGSSAAPQPPSSSCISLFMNRANSRCVHCPPSSFESNATLLYVPSAVTTTSVRGSGPNATSDRVKSGSLNCATERSPAKPRFAGKNPAAKVSADCATPIGVVADGVVAVALDSAEIEDPPRPPTSASSAVGFFFSVTPEESARASDSSGDVVSFASSDPSQTCPVPLSLEHAKNSFVAENAMEYMVARSAPRRNSRRSVALAVSYTRTNVPFSDAVARRAPSSESAAWRGRRRAR